MKKRALISVSDKNGLTEFAQFLEQNNYELISTGGTFKHLKEAGLNPIQIDEVTNFPEMLDGRVKTLHPKVHGGLLAVRDNEEHMKTVAEHEIGLIDMVIVNLYPFFENVTRRRISNLPFCFLQKSFRFALRRKPSPICSLLRFNI